jgi:hypothetical protein
VLNDLAGSWARSGAGLCGHSEGVRYHFRHRALPSLEGDCSAFSLKPSKCRIGVQPAAQSLTECTKALAVFCRGRETNAHRGAPIGPSVAITLAT